MPRELELSWVAKLKQWRKRRKVNGKTKTFCLGAGTSKSDRLSYVRALTKWREIEETLNLAERGGKLRQGLDAWRDELASRRLVSSSKNAQQLLQLSPMSSMMMRNNSFVATHTEYVSNDAVNATNRLLRRREGWRICTENGR